MCQINWPAALGAPGLDGPITPKRQGRFDTLPSGSHLGPIGDQGFVMAGPNYQLSRVVWSIRRYVPTATQSRRSDRPGMDTWQHRPRAASRPGPGLALGCLVASLRGKIWADETATATQKSNATVSPLPPSAWKAERHCRAVPRTRPLSRRHASRAAPVNVVRCRYQSRWPLPSLPRSSPSFHRDKLEGEPRRPDGVRPKPDP